MRTIQGRRCSNGFVMAWQGDDATDEDSPALHAVHERQAVLGDG